MKNYTLPDIERIRNVHLQPSVICPCGCYEFIHKCGTVTIDVMI